MFSFFNSSLESESMPVAKLDVILATALKYVKTTCVLGASNKLSDIKKTNGWVLFPQYRYNQLGQYVKKKPDELDKSDNLERYYDESLNNVVARIDKKWFYHGDHYHKLDHNIVGHPRGHLSPLLDPKFQLKNDHFRLLLRALFVQTARYGNCYSRACLLAKYLWEKKTQIKRIEIMSFKNFDHVVVVVNRRENSELSDPVTWEGYVIDSWYEEGLIYSSKEFIKKAEEVREYIRKGYLEATEMNLIYTDQDDKVVDLKWTVQHEILPGKNLYPTYSLDPFCPIEDYYLLSNNFTLDLLSGDDHNFSVLIKELQSHQEKFKASLDGIKGMQKKEVHNKLC